MSLTGRLLVALAVFFLLRGGAAWADPEDPSTDVSAPPPESPPARRGAAPRWQGYVDLGAGLSYHYQLGEHFFSGRGEFEAGAARSTGFAIGGRIAVEGGRTLAGLTFYSVQWGPALEWRLSQRVGLGLLPYLGVLGIQRITKDNDPLWTPLLGVTLRTRVDLLSNGRGGGLYWQLEAGVDGLLLSFSPVATNLATGLGYRF